MISQGSDGFVIILQASIEFLLLAVVANQDAVGLDGVRVLLGDSLEGLLRIMQGFIVVAHVPIGFGDFG